jgi:hypothetical protein
MHSQARCSGTILLCFAAALFVGGCRSIPRAGQVTEQHVQELETEIEFRMQDLSSRMENLQKSRSLVALGLTPDQQRKLDAALEELQKDPKRIAHAQDLLRSLRVYDTELLREEKAFAGVLALETERVAPDLHKKHGDAGSKNDPAANRQQAP